MNKSFVKSKRVDWEQRGYETMLACNDEPRAIEICGLHLHADADELQPKVSRLKSEIEHSKHHAAALHEHLYDRPVPVSDASMLTHSLRERVILSLCFLTAGTCLVSNFIMFWYLAWGIVWSAFAAMAITAFPLGLGHLFYEKLVAVYKGLQIAMIVVIAVAGFGAFYQFGLARRAIMDTAAAQSAMRSYTDDSASDDAPGGSRPQDGNETKVNGTLGGAAFLITIAAELAIGFLVGCYMQLRTDEDYVAWRKLKEIYQYVVGLNEKVAELLFGNESAKKQCLAGIRRAQSTRNKRRTPYHKFLGAFALLALVRVPSLHSQTVERYEGILIDTSSSISRGGTTDLFQEYLHSTKRLLATEPPKSRVWVSSISRDSFGGAHEIVKGWTPGARGIFIDELNRARHQLASNFEAKSSDLVPTDAGTDIFGGLWHFKALFESTPNSSSANGFPKTIRMFSDMMNESSEFPMPQMLAIGPERMLERAKANGLLLPLPHYEIYVYGASSKGLTPRAWLTMKRFWEMYFFAAGAKLITYSPDCDVQQ